MHERLITLVGRSTAKEEMGMNYRWLYEGEDPGEVIMCGHAVDRGETDADYDSA